MFTRRRLRSLTSLLLSATIGVALIGIGANPAEADPNPIEDTYRYEEDAQGNPTNPGPLNDLVVYDNDGDLVDDECVIEEDPQYGHTIVYPDPPGAFGDHPVVVWGNGTSGTIGIAEYWDYFPELFPDEILIEDSTCLSEKILKHLASWGFVVIAPNDGFVGSGAELQQAVDVAEWLNNVPPTSGNPNPFYQNLDLLSIAAAGHSQGAHGAINAAVADSRITSVLSVSTPDEFYCHPNFVAAIDALGPEWEYEGCAPVATASQLDVPIFFVTGENDCWETSVLAKPALREYLDEIGDYWLGEGNLTLWQYYDNLANWVWNNLNCFSSDVSNTAYYNAISGPAAKGIALADPPGIFGTGAGHIDLSEGIGYMTAWLGYISGNPGFAGAEDAFTGTSPEITTNSGWTDWQAKNLPT